MKKTRIDEELVRRGLAADGEIAKRLVMAGKVLVEEERVEKPGTLIEPGRRIRLKTSKGRYVSRAGHKLEAALTGFGIHIHGLTVMDLGASTGGFTDCMLQFGARVVYAVDVGTNQLDYGLRTHPDVVCLERTHAKRLNKELVPEAIDFLAVDVSFTSLSYVLPNVRELLTGDARAVCLLKPQFEVAKEKVRPGGRVTEANAAEACHGMEAWFRTQDIQVLGSIKSPVKGKGGTQEFLYWLAFAKTPSQP